MTLRPPRSTPLSLHDALPISLPMFALLQDAASGGSLLPPEIKALLDVTGCVAVVVVVVLFLRHLKSLREARAKAETERSEEHTSELQSHVNLVCRLLLEKKKK